MSPLGSGRGLRNGSVIASVAGVSEAVAREIVAARQKTGDFSSIEDLDLLVDLPPADVAKFKDAGVRVPRD
jgi:DNA uptake protein ComE-like DNA-binding protein